MAARELLLLDRQIRRHPYARPLGELPRVLGVASRAALHPPACIDRPAPDHPSGEARDEKAVDPPAPRPELDEALEDDVLRQILSGVAWQDPFGESPRQR